MILEDKSTKTSVEVKTKKEGKGVCDRLVISINGVKAVDIWFDGTVWIDSEAYRPYDIKSTTHLKFCKKGDRML